MRDLKCVLAFQFVLKYGGKKACCVASALNVRSSDYILGEALTKSP